MYFYSVQIKTSTILVFESKEELLPFTSAYDLESGQEIYRNFFKKENEKAYMFPQAKCNREGCVVLHLASADRMSPYYYAEQMIRMMGMHDGKVAGVEEIGLIEFFAYLRTAYRKGIIDVDEEDFFRMFHLEELEYLFRRGNYRWDEELLFTGEEEQVKLIREERAQLFSRMTGRTKKNQRRNKSNSKSVKLPEYTLRSKKKLLKDVSSLFCAQDLTDELEKIYQPQTIKGEGIPVHYVFQYTDPASIKDSQRVLTKALYLNGRLRSSRVMSIHIDEEEGLTEEEMEEIQGMYRVSQGGAIAIDFQRGIEYDSSFAQAGRGLIESLCRIIRDNRHKVLTILHVMDREVKKTFFEFFDRMTFVEISEQPADLKHANRYLRKRAGDKTMSSDKNLLLQGGDGFTRDYLDRRFVDWYEKKLKNKVYPQYKQQKTISLNLDKHARHGDAITVLNNMIGLKEAKDTIGGILDHHKMKKIMARFDMPAQELSLHMVFSGNPGTAKTTVARLYARILRENGILSRGNLIEVGRKDLVGKYVGWTAKIVQDYFRKARGSVLFIDEAYSLVDHDNGGFGTEAIDAIVQEIENNREDIAVIFAGYSAPMNEFLSSNPDLRSRINYMVDFPDYEEDDLIQIIDQLAAEKKLVLTDNARAKVREYIRSVCGSDDFGNGRFMRNLLEQAIVQHSSRLLHSDLDQVKEDDVKQLTREDFENLRVTQKESVKAAIGFI